MQCGWVANSFTDCWDVKLIHPVIEWIMSRIDGQIFYWKRRDCTGFSGLSAGGGLWRSNQSIFEGIEARISLANRFPVGCLGTIYCSCTLAFERWGEFTQTTGHKTQAFTLFLCNYPARRYASPGPSPRSNPSDLTTNELQLFTTKHNDALFYLSTHKFLKYTYLQTQSNIATMPPKLEPDETMKFLYTCFKNSDFNNVRVNSSSRSIQCH